MTVRRRLVLLAPVAALLAGCTTSAPETPAPSTPEASPPPAGSTVLTALDQLRTSTYRYLLTVDSAAGPRFEASGAHDPARQLFTRKYQAFTGADAGSGQVITIGDDAWTRVGKTTTWSQVPLALFDAKSFLLGVDSYDPVGLLGLSKVIGAVTRTGPATFTGTVDPTRDDGRFLPLGAPGLDLTGSDTATWTAELDTAGRLTSVVVTANPGPGPITMTTTFAGQGEPVTITKPQI
ncbi:hypothetical protein [Actinoplanes awajinensis]|uniref:LppX_LprAFG lipoprotein n=1 Tax=Actinoplanes awajinensis subsp. mycoplanecinus TaxID=135947 RepID=A0A101JRP7_9ACTN|nr:hypothetical protein [Actinoplanes awajinensis]KUL31918.1 hypothetical protein ADL15_20620 [Actinoplanes awajinensis subsp. mycoplanecinus]